MLATEIHALDLAVEGMDEGGEGGANYFGLSPGDDDLLARDPFFCSSRTYM